MDNEVIFGKNPTEGIVGCEVHDDKVCFFIETPNGIEEKWEPNLFWIMTAKQLDTSWQRLEGNLYYKWVKTYTTEDEWKEQLKLLGRKRIDYFSSWNAKENSMLVKGFSYYKGLKPKEVSVLAFDIETPGIKLDEDSGVILIANTYRKGDTVIRKLFAYDEFKSQAEMLTEWCNWVREMNPSILLAYNGNTFDIPYLMHVADMHGITLDLGRDGSPLSVAERSSKFRKDGSQSLTYFKPRVYGREVIDVFFLAIRYDIGKKYDNYKLKSIIKHEGLEAEDRVHYDASQIRFNYTNPLEFVKIKQYAEDDGDDAIKLFDLMVPAQFYSARSIPKPFQAITESATGSQINAMMVREYLRNFHSIPKADDSVDFEGAISLGVPGIYRNVRKVDVASLYPSIMLHYEVYPKHKDVLGVFPTMLAYFRTARLEHKQLAKETGDQYYKDLEQTEKIMINSKYGFLGATGLNFNSPKDAARVTRLGREILERGVKWASGQDVFQVVKHTKNKGKANEEDQYEWKLFDTEDKGKGFKIVNCDTDSFSYVNPLGGDFDEEISELNSLYPSTISWEDDGEYKAVVVIRAKNYYLVDEKIKIKGSALKATNKEKALQEMISELLTYMSNVEHGDMEIVHAAVEEMYMKYVKEVVQPTINIKRWTTKKSITDKVLKPKRSQEAKVLAAIQGTEYKESDKIRVYFDTALALVLEEHYSNNHDVDTLLGKIHDTLKVFSTIIDIKRFPDFSTKKNKKILSEML